MNYLESGRGGIVGLGLGRGDDQWIFVLVFLLPLSIPFFLLDNLGSFCLENQTKRTKIKSLG